MDSLAARLKRRAAEEGFDGCRIAPAATDALAAARLGAFLDAGFHGDMAWMAETRERRAAPATLWSEARSAVMLAVSYTPTLDPMARLGAKDRGTISVYALGRDYHDVIKGKLKRLARWLARASGARAKVFVDTAPLMEKPLAQAAGLGWQGKHTNLLARELGSWFFLGAILTDAELDHDPPERDHCGTCTACLDICPTQAFPAPYVLDARRCISYLTIEHKGHIAREFRAAMGNRIFGCDDCLAVCPWNKFAQTARETKLAARADLETPPLAELLRLDDAGFRARFAGSPVKRAGRDRFLRNVLIAAGNAADPSLIADIEPLLDDASPLIRAMAVWALAQLEPLEALSTRALSRIGQESDAAVLAEWLNQAVVR